MEICWYLYTGEKMFANKKTKKKIKKKINIISTMRQNKKKNNINKAS